ncbi:hypothetical protein [Pseudarthrobacter sp. BRE9]|uniref:hypothetical protein n=1 Tax=Pseudarthrobacter sp. BRE9 TaxID=2962582 RepID=UPI002882AF6E|nr:hypothetical protein [Pseudarthrobacter sp. BRE9]MDT0170257.1 hypothetical protein [Pseudarthrobacter sp. BRE9]
MSVVAESVMQGLVQGAWAVLLCGPVLVVSVAVTVFVVRRRALAAAGSAPLGPDQLFWDLFLGSCVAVPALLIPALVSPWAGLVLAGAAAASGIAAYRGSPRFLAWRAGRREERQQFSAHQAATLQHDELLRRWQRYELDPACSIDYPALADVRLPETSALIKAMRTAEQLRTATHKGYPDAVGTLAASLAAAERAAGIPAGIPVEQAG